VTSALRAMRCAAQNQPANDVLDAKAIELQVHDPAQCEGHDGMPVEYEVAVVPDLTCVDPSMQAQNAPPVRGRCRLRISASWKLGT
jgi:hypothetical protein